jgi:hypothetical protein
MTTTYIPLHVPESHYPAMLEHLIELTSGRTTEKLHPAEKTPAETSAELPSNDFEERWRAAWDDLRADGKKIFVYVAERHGERVPYANVVDDLFDGVPRSAQNATISITPRLKRNKIDKWPMKVVPDEDGFVTYVMDEATARIILQVASENPA